MSSNPKAQDKQKIQPEVGIIILAAGSSSRMGQSKQLLDIGGGHLLQKTIQQALNTHATKVIVVLGANELEHRKSITHLPVDIVTNADWQLGMGNSLKKGLHQLLQLLPDADAALILVCDQPLLTTAHLNKIIQTFRETKCLIVASAYSGSAGVPALFEKSVFEKIKGLEDGSGAKKIIQQNRHLVRTIDFPQGAIDLDTPEDYQAYLKRRD